MGFDYSGLANAETKLTALANQVRSMTGETSNLSIEGMTEALSALNLINYGTVKAGSTSIPATTQADTLSLVAGTGITLTGDATNKKITISSSSSKNFSSSISTLIDYGNSTLNTNLLTTRLYVPFGSSYTGIDSIIVNGSSSKSGTAYRGWCRSLGTTSNLANKILIINSSLNNSSNSTYDYYSRATFIVNNDKFVYYKSESADNYNHTNTDWVEFIDYANTDGTELIASNGSGDSGLKYLTYVFIKDSNVYVGLTKDYTSGTTYYGVDNILFGSGVSYVYYKCNFITIDF